MRSFSCALNRNSSLVARLTFFLASLSYWATIILATNGCGLDLNLNRMSQNKGHHSTLQTILQEEYQLFLKRSYPVFTGPVPAHLKTRTNVTFEDTSTYYEFQLCKFDSQAGTSSEHHCFNPFYDDNGPLVLNRYTLIL